MKKIENCHTESYLEVNFRRFSIVGLAQEVMASMSPVLKWTQTSSPSSWLSLARNKTLLIVPWELPNVNWLSFAFEHQQRCSCCSSAACPTSNEREWNRMSVTTLRHVAQNCRRQFHFTLHTLPHTSENLKPKYRLNLTKSRRKSCIIWSLES